MMIGFPVDPGLLVLPLAVILDLLVGDPMWLPHPIVWMGRAIAAGERLFRRIFTSPFTAGLVMAVLLIVAVWGMAAGLIALAGAVHPVLGTALEVILLFYCFSVRTLAKEAEGVARALTSGGLRAGQQQVARIVGREVDALDETGVASAAVETVAENYVDGFLSPLFFFVLGGVPLALAYKIVNTLDSMIGYRNEKYLLFGRAAARIDDVANWIPARLSVVFISLSVALLSRQRAKQAFETARREGRQHKSPNAGFPEAAFAGAQGVKLGGPNVYHGTVVEKPFIGKAFDRPGIGDVGRACELMVLSGLTAAIVVWSLQILIIVL